MTDRQVEQIRQALTETLEMPSMKVVMGALLLEGLANLPLETYRPIGDLEGWARQMGYHEIPWGAHGAGLHAAYAAEAVYGSGGLESPPRGEELL